MWSAAEGRGEAPRNDRKRMMLYWGRGIGEGACRGGGGTQGAGDWAAAETLTPKDKRSRRGGMLWQWRELSGESEVSSRGADEGEGEEAVKHCATIERAVAMLGRMRRRCNHPKTKQGRGRWGRGRPGTGGAESPPHLQKGLTRVTRELRRPARNAEGRDYIILITLIILIRG